jgi:hypothetical protein
MLNLFLSATTQAGGLTPEGHRAAVNMPGAANEPGRRLMRLAVAYAQYDPQDADWLLQMLDNFTSSFEHHWCIETLRSYIGRYTTQQRALIVDILDRHREAIQQDPGRADLAEQLRTSALSGAPVSSTASGSAPPMQSEIAEEASEEFEDPESHEPIESAQPSEEILTSKRVSTPRPRHSQQRKIAAKKK